MTLHCVLSSFLCDFMLPLYGGCHFLSCPGDLQINFQKSLGASLYIASLFDGAQKNRIVTLQKAVEIVSKYRAPWGVCCGTWAAKNVVPLTGNRTRCAGLPGQCLFNDNHVTYVSFNPRKLTWVNFSPQWQLLQALKSLKFCYQLRCICSSG